LPEPARPRYVWCGMKRCWLGVMLCATFGACLAACERELFDHAAASHGPREDGGIDAAVGRGPPPADQCDGKPDGARCDDWDACTPASTCRAGACAPGDALDDCTLADSAAEFGESQGEQGWHYGYWVEGSDADGSYAPSELRAMEYCGDSTWRPPGICELTRDQPGFRWTQNLAWGLQHPETMPEVELPIRRWVSDVSGPASLLIEHHVKGEFSDGTRALLLFDGREVWRNVAQGGDPVGVSELMAIELSEGMLVEQLVHPIDGSADDTTYFTIRIEGR
jgi:hypothetical protein